MSEAFDRFNTGLPAILAMPPGTEKVAQLAVYGLLTDGGHHKQWFLQEILAALGERPDKIRGVLQEQDYDWEDGIPP